MMKYFLVILAITHFSKCEHGSAGEKEVKVTVLKATSQSWIGGAVGMGKGTQYRFFLPIEDTIFEFDSVWVEGYRIAAEETFDPLSPDTLIVEAKLFFPGKGIAPDDGPKPQPPVKTASIYPDCPAYLRILNQDKSYHSDYCLPKIEVLPRILYE